MKTRSKEEALDLLENTRMALVQQGRRVAVELIEKNGSTHTRALRAEMDRLGKLPPSIDERWLGAVFTKKKIFKWNGELFFVQDAERNIHAGRPVKIWVLQKGYRNEAF